MPIIKYKNYYNFFKKKNLVLYYIKVAWYNVSWIKCVDATCYGNLEHKELKLASGQSRFLCGANSSLLQEEYFSSQPVVLKAHRFHDYTSTIWTENQWCEWGMLQLNTALIVLPFLLSFITGESSIQAPVQMRLDVSIKHIGGIDCWRVIWRCCGRVSTFKMAAQQAKSSSDHDGKNLFCPACLSCSYLSVALPDTLPQLHYQTHYLLHYLTHYLSCTTRLTTYLTTWHTTSVALPDSLPDTLPQLHYQTHYLLDYLTHYLSCTRLIETNIKSKIVNIFELQLAIHQKYVRFFIWTLLIFWLKFLFNLPIRLCPH